MMRHVFWGRIIDYVMRYRWYGITIVFDMGTGFVGSGRSALYSIVQFKGIAVAGCMLCVLV